MFLVRVRWGWLVLDCQKLGFAKPMPQHTCLSVLPNLEITQMGSCLYSWQAPKCMLLVSTYEAMFLLCLLLLLLHWFHPLGDVSTLNSSLISRLDSFVISNGSPTSSLLCVDALSKLFWSNDSSFEVQQTDVQYLLFKCYKIKSPNFKGLIFFRCVHWSMDFEGKEFESRW